MTLKDFIKTVNEIAQNNIDKAVGMVEAYNMINGTKFWILARRVSFTCIEHGHKDAHDAYVWADELEAGRFEMVTNF